MHIALDKDFGNDDLISLPTFMMIFLFPPLMNLYLTRLKVALTKKRKVAEELKLKVSSLIENLDQGFMVIDKNGIIEDGATEASKLLFGKEIEGKKFSEVLNSSEEKRDTLDKWLKNIWRGIIPFNDLKALGPNHFKKDERYIGLDYRPIYKKDSKRKVEKVICIATDKTQEVELEKKLELDKENVEFIKTCLRNPMEFLDLVNDSQDTILDSEELLKKSNFEELFRVYHTLKARWGQFGIKTISSYINEVETCIDKELTKEIKESVYILKMKLQEFLKENDLIVSAANKSMADEGKALLVSEVLEISNRFETKEDFTFHLKTNFLFVDIKEKFERYRPIINEIAQKQEKDVNLEISGDVILVDYSRYSNFINSSIHVFRNMVDHGIEKEDERIEKFKPQKGLIKLEFKERGDNFDILIRDDGRGIKPSAIKNILLERNLMSQDEADKQAIIL